MRLFSLLVLACLLTQSVPAAASTPDDFEKAVKEKGPEYVAARDKLLQPDADVNFIKGKLQSDSPRERLTAQIILGWRDHKDEYKKLLSESIVDQRGEKRFP